jgi:hypothetical protein
MHVRIAPWFPASVALIWASTALAQVHAGDIILTLDGGGIVTGGLSADSYTPRRVFGATLGVTFANFTDNPGFDCVPGTFPVPSRNGFRILDSLRVWDGSDFHLIAAPTMEVAFSTLSVTSPPTPSTVEGFTLAVGSNGEWHRHLEYTLGSPADPGIYLLQLQLYSNSGGIGASLPFWLVFNQGRPTSEHEAAVTWVRFNLAGESACGTSDFNGDGDFGTDQDIEAFFACLAGNCCPACFPLGSDFNGDGDFGTDQDIEAFFRVLAGGVC